MICVVKTEKPFSFCDTIMISLNCIPFAYPLWTVPGGSVLLHLLPEKAFRQCRQSPPSYDLRALQFQGTLLILQRFDQDPTHDLYLH